MEPTRTPLEPAAVSRRWRAQEGRGAEGHGRCTPRWLLIRGTSPSNGSTFLLWFERPLLLTCVESESIAGCNRTMASCVGSTLTYNSPSSPPAPAGAARGLMRTPDAAPACIPSAAPVSSCPSPARLPFAPSRGGVRGGVSASLSSEQPPPPSPPPATPPPPLASPRPKAESSGASGGRSPPSSASESSSPSSGKAPLSRTAWSFSAWPIAASLRSSLRQSTS